MKTPRLVALFSMATIVAWAGSLPAQAITDDDVVKAIEKGKAYLISLANPDGSFSKSFDVIPVGERSVLFYMTLAYLGEPPSREYMAKGLDYLLRIDVMKDLGNRQGYSVPIHIMGLSYVYNKVPPNKRTAIRLKIQEDLMYLIRGQATNGGWRYGLKGGADYDFSVTQWPILAMREANLVGIEFPTDCLVKARELYFKGQNPDGGWAYQTGNSYGSMTAAGLASLFIITDVLDPASGCPCTGGKTRRHDLEAERRMESALGWLGKNFAAPGSPRGPNDPPEFNLYGLYCAERVGIAGGYKYFGDHNWYKEGAENLVKNQGPDGAWNNQIDTCFALLFLYKGRAPILFNKLKFDGTWNAHRRDMANLVGFVEREKEQPFHWQIVELKAPLDELHDAPILYITPESIPQFSDTDKKKLRAYTDTGGTVLFEASCGNPQVRKWFQNFAKEIWPEWTLKPLGPDHPSYSDPNPLERRPEVLGLDDGMRTFLFYSMDDVSCPWQTKAYTAREYLFKWGINLFTYAMDRAPLRAKLAPPEAPKADRYATPLKAGAKNALRLVRLKYDGPWMTNRNYSGFERIAAALQKRAAVALKVDDAGVAPSALGDQEVAYLVGNTKEITLADADKQALKAYLAKGGFLWAEGAGGSIAFGDAVKQLATDLGWELKPLRRSDPILTGKFKAAVGYDLTNGVQFRRVLKVDRASQAYAPLDGIYQDGKLVGVYSPLDVVFSVTPYEAYGNRGYESADALAVAANIVVYLTDRAAGP
jgi:hypothetical protein